ncbi:armadillo-type protein [Phascolomyces articulosus]|uniref:Armadillo-type protein n=1 Tax=Phascolomyces articulosus TaxID=60185 RepID=A0AAD5K8E1_9FUNG|nr:armadillo-type protein [Phascolomyces articulosus]
MMADARSQLLGVLHEAASQDYTVMRQAEEVLKQWENESSFFATLQDIFYDPSIHHDVRVLSGIYLKNGVGRFWRKTAKNPINAEEKTAIRQRLLQFMDEPSKKLTAQNAVIVARIARMDYPMEWPDLLPSLVQIIETPSGNERLIHDRAFEMLYEILHELSTRFLSASRRQFAQVAPRIFQTVANMYVTYTTNTVSTLSAQTADPAILLTELEIVSACIKCLRILMVSGIRDVHKYDETKTFIQLSKQRLEEYVNIRSLLQQQQQTPSLENIQEMVNTIIEDHGSLYLGLQKAHPVSCALCPAWTDILGYYWQAIIHEGTRLTDRYKTGEPVDIPVFEQFLLQGMLLIKETIKNAAQNVDNPASEVLSVTDEEKALCLEANRIINNQFLTTEFVNACAEALITKYMLLTPVDMEKWEDDPEGFANAIDSENWEFELRPCAEMTFMSLLTHYRDQLCPILLDLVEKVAHINTFQELLFKDAVYAAVGLGVQSIYGRLDFETFLVNRLIPEISQKNAGSKILHRRIAWLLGRWVNEGISADSRVAIYQGLLELLVTQDDMVVRLTAAHSLRQAIDDWDFEISILLPYLGPAMDLLLKLLNEVEESDTVMKLISDLNTIADRTGEHMVPYAPKIIDLLVPHWQRAEDNPLFQSALVVTFTKITAILKEQSVHVQHFFLPIVRYGVNKENKAHVYLLEDVLDLWWTMLQTAPQSSPELFSMLPSAIGLLEYDTEGLRKTLKIIESYLLLDGQATLQQCAGPLFSGLATYIGSTKDEVAASISYVGETALQSCPVQIYDEALIQSGLLRNILDVFIQDQLYAHAIMSYMTLFARLAICDAQFLLNYLRMTGQQVTGTTQDDFVGNVLERWMEKFDNIGHTRARKLNCIALTNLLRTNDPVVLARLPHLMAIWIDLLAEVNEVDEDLFLYAEADLAGDVAELDQSSEKDRRSKLRREDPVYTTNLSEMVRQALRIVEQHYGGAQAFQDLCLSKVDPTVLDQVNKALTNQ